MIRQLRPYQERAIISLRESLKSGKKRPVLQLPTGGGKTRVAGEIVRMARAKGKRVMFTVPSLSLVNQTVASFQRDGIAEIGVIQADHEMTDPNQPVQVATIQSLSRRKRPDVDLVIVDEAHTMFRAFLEWIASDEMKDIPVIGLSATPWAKGMGKHYDDLIVCATLKDMIDQGYLSPFKVFAPSHPDLSGVSVSKGDYAVGELADVMSKPKLVADVVDTWIKMGDGRPTLAFCVNRAHARHVQDSFEAAGIPCGYVDAFTEMDERERISQKFHAGAYKVVANVGTLTTGVDWDVRCIIDARPTKSEALFVQIYGRGLRTAPGKADCIILDHADNYTRHGFVTDIHHESLDDGSVRTASKRKGALPKECPKCTFLKPPKVAQCPCCGFKPEGSPRSDIETEDGDLSEIVRGKGTKATGPKNTVKIGGVWLHLADFYGQLKFRERERGYRKGWADNQYRSAVQVWPNAYKNAPPKPVTWEVDIWLKAQQIRYAKRREKERAAHAQPAA
ncbi:DEAD/DEAH box helicase [Azospirillum sp. A1-3]|uniref:DEAD/DEAH box helicase n=1 Tax=Azospirillum sp. A1-3 TaxID=185874 RepID=UPI002076DDBB|nr:DEAD/DEAH box helicase [Azospirillum sp. A1-3]MCM8735971.1 DEAD/DEAH box helicase [Azospirillum sp. A1-3]